MSGLPKEAKTVGVDNTLAIEISPVEERSKLVADIQLLTAQPPLYSEIVNMAGLDPELSSWNNANPDWVVGQFFSDESDVDNQKFDQFFTRAANLVQDGGRLTEIVSTLSPLVRFIRSLNDTILNAYYQGGHFSQPRDGQITLKHRGVALERMVRDEIERMETLTPGVKTSVESCSNSLATLLTAKRVINTVWESMNKTVMPNGTGYLRIKEKWSELTPDQRLEALLSKLAANQSKKAAQFIALSRNPLIRDPLSNPETYPFIGILPLIAIDDGTVTTTAVASILIGEKPLSWFTDSEADFYHIGQFSDVFTIGNRSLQIVSLSADLESDIRPHLLAWNNAFNSL